MVFFGIRRARVRPEFAELYPQIVGQIWVSARAAASAVRRAHRRQGREAISGQRVLTDAHFEFRGGQRQRQAARAPWTRAGDGDPDHTTMPAVRMA